MTSTRRVSAVKQLSRLHKVYLALIQVFVGDRQGSESHQVDSELG